VFVAGKLPDRVSEHRTVLSSASARSGDIGRGARTGACTAFLGYLGSRAHLRVGYKPALGRRWLVDGYVRITRQTPRCFYTTTSTWAHAYNVSSKATRKKKKKPSISSRSVIADRVVEGLVFGRADRVRFATQVKVTNRPQYQWMRFQ